MGRSLTNNFNLQYAIEQTIGTLPATPAWKVLEPNALSTFGAAITTVARSPISAKRGRRKGTVTSLTSAVEFDCDLTLSAFQDFAEGFVFSNFVGAETEKPDACDADSFDMTTNPLTAAPVQRTLAFIRNMATTANNGVKMIGAGSTTTDVVIDGGGLTAEATAPAAAELSICGFRTAVGDLDVDADGNLLSTALDFTTLPLFVGMEIFIGGDVALNQFTNAENAGFARIIAIEANKLTLDKTQQTFVVEANTTQEVDIYFGRFLKDRSVNDGDYLMRYFQFEGAYAGLHDDSVSDMYEYSKGNACNTMTLDLPLQDKATMNFAFVGTDTDVPTATRALNADTPSSPNQTGAFNTSADIARMRIQKVDETGIATCFKSLSLTLGNNVSPENCLGSLGASFMNVGGFDVSIEGQLLFTNYRVIEAIRNNETLGLDFALRNDDGAIYIDIPSITIGGGEREFPVNESILVSLTGEAFIDSTLETSIGITHFPYVPAS